MVLSVLLYFYSENSFLFWKILLQCKSKKYGVYIEMGKLT